LQSSTIPFQGSCYGASPHELHHGIQPGSHQIPHRFVDLIGHPNGGQPAGTMLNGQLLRIPSVGFDPLKDGAATVHP
jgi:hypothetical protein